LWQTGPPKKASKKKTNVCEWLKFKKKSIKQENKKKVQNKFTCGPNSDSLNHSDESDLDIDPGLLEPNSNDATCIFCDVMFSNDKKGQLWIQCLMCHLWAHTEYAGALHLWFLQIRLIIMTRLTKEIKFQRLKE